MQINSILTSIKKILGIQDYYDNFDSDLILCINSALAILTQLGVGPEEGFTISNASATWQDFAGEDPRLEMMKSFVHLRVRLLFDPPQNASLADAMEKMAKEFEWRILVAAENAKTAEAEP